jgi:hypothetical protein
MRRVVVLHNPDFLDPKFQFGTATENEMIIAINKSRIVAVCSTDNFDKAYELTNSIDRPWTENKSVMVIGGHEHRSTSVGDFMRIFATGENYYMVAPTGFKKIESTDF